MFYWSADILPEIHPIVVHWPFTLAVLTGLADINGHWIRSSAWLHRAYSVLLRILIGAMVLSDLTGFLAEGLVRIPSALQPRIHWLIGYTLSATGLGWAAWLVEPHPTLPASGTRRLLASVLLFGTVLLLGLGDHVGYVLVYHYGIGTETGIPPVHGLAISRRWLIGGAIGLSISAVGTAIWWRGRRMGVRLLHRMLEMRIRMRRVSK